MKFDDSRWNFSPLSRPWLRPVVLLQGAIFENIFSMICSFKEKLGITKNNKCFLLKKNEINRKQWRSICAIWSYLRNYNKHCKVTKICSPNLPPSISYAMPCSWRTSSSVQKINEPIKITCAKVGRYSRQRRKRSYSGSKKRLKVINAREENQNIVRVDVWRDVLQLSVVSAPFSVARPCPSYPPSTTLCADY